MRHRNVTRSTAETQPTRAADTVPMKSPRGPTRTDASSRTGLGLSKLHVPRLAPVAASTMTATRRLISLEAFFMSLPSRLALLMTVLIATLATVRQPAHAQWTQLAAQSPPQSLHAAAYDSRRNVVVVFGRLPVGGFPGGDTTWEFDGNAWTQRMVQAPPARYGHAMAYDSVRGVAVLWGGIAASGENLADLWEWDGTTWAQRESSGPPGSYYISMAFDEARREVVLPLARTWTWDGVQWSQRTNGGGPSVRSYPGLTYDSRRRVVVLHGAGGGENETWEWNGAAWTLMATAGPGGRSHSTMCYDASRGVCMLFGGTNGRTPAGYNNTLGDTWEWDGRAWRQVAESGPPPRNAHSTVFLPLRNRVVMFAGKNDRGNDLTDMWEWNGCAPPVVISQPSSRFVTAGQAVTLSLSVIGEPTAVQWSRGGVPLADGGRISGARTTTLTISSIEREDVGDYSCNLSNACASTSIRPIELLNRFKWTQRSAIGPPPRAFSDMDHDPVRDEHILFGGQTSTNARGDTWRWDGRAWTLAASFGPPARSRHSMAFDPSRGTIVLYGGRGWSSSTAFGDTWEWDGVEWRPVTTSGPPARHSASLHHDPVLGGLLLVGGQNAAATSLADTWIFRDGAWTEVAATSLTARHGHAAFFDPILGDSLLQGGLRTSAAALTGTWRLDRASQAWTVAHSMPSSRAFHSVAIDTARRVAVMFGGLNNSASLGTTMEWEPSSLAWVERASSGPLARHGAAMSFDAARGHCVLFGGVNGANYLRDTWAWGAESECLEPVVLVHPDSREVPCGSAFSLAVTAAGNPAPTFRWRRDGLDIPGATSNLFTATASPETRGTYDCVVASVCGTTVTSTATITTSGTPIEINAHPSDLAVAIGAPATLDVDAIGANLAFRWLKDGRPLDDDARIGGTASRTLHIARVEPGDTGDYVCIVFNACGSTHSSAARLNCTPIFTRQPTGGESRGGSEIVLVADVANPDGIAFRWRKDDLDLVDDGAFSGSATPTLVILARGPEHSGAYVLTASNACGTASSSPAIVDVVCLTDFNRDGGIDGEDLFLFFTLWETGHNSADINLDGGVDLFDVDTFFQGWESGC